MQRNLRLYPLYQGLRSAVFWVPVFFLYFSSLFSLEKVLQLEAIYYLAVVVLEVPSGYFSDRVGRKPTLLMAMGFWASAGVLFTLSQDFFAFAVAQVLLAAGMAFNSGTDTSLLYDSLVAAGLEEEIGEREGRAEAVGFTAAAAASLIGGLAAGFDLRLAYLLFGLSAFGAFCIALGFREPRHARSTPEAALAPHRQLAACLARLSDGVLLWIFVFLVAMTIFNHVPYEFLQPYLDFLFGTTLAGTYRTTPALTGILGALTMLVSAFAARKAMALRRRLGVAGSLLGALALQLGIILAMGLVLHPVVVVLILLRSVPRAVMTPISRSLIHPRLESRIRATWLSLLSLVGRLSFSLTLWAASWAAHGEGHISPEVMSRILQGYAALAGGVLLGLLVYANRVRKAAVGG